jgi:multisubunit Na+/H+ antiporter MnhE subunit
MQMKNNVLSFIILFITWLILTWSLSIPELALGLIVCLITLYATVKLFGDPDIEPSNPLKLVWLLLVGSFLLWDLFKASVFGLWSILKPPASEKTLFIEVKTFLRNGTALAILMNALTLIPGAAVAALNAKTGSISLHLMSVKNDNYSSFIELTVKKYEGLLLKVFE